LSATCHNEEDEEEEEERRNGKRRSALSQLELINVQNKVNLPLPVVSIN
jgi:hypothetical protein